MLEVSKITTTISIRSFVHIEVTKILHFENVNFINIQNCLNPVILF